MLTVYGDLNLKQLSLRSKRFQSSYCAKVRAEAKKRLKGEGRRGSFFPLPLPRHSFFFALVPAFETNLARKRLLRRLEATTPLPISTSLETLASGKFTMTVFNASNV